MWIYVWVCTCCMFILKSSYQIAAIQKCWKQCHKHRLTKIQTKLKTEPFRRGATGNKGGRIKGHQQLLHQKKSEGGAF